jgi:hypothetical protein
LERSCLESAYLTIQSTAAPNLAHGKLARLIVSFVKYDHFDVEGHRAILDTRRTFPNDRHFVVATKEAIEMVIA